MLYGGLGFSTDTAMAKPAAAPWMLFFVGLVLCGASLGTDAADDLVITRAERRVDLTSQAVRTLVSLKIENTGSKPASEVLFVLSKEQNEKLSIMTASAVAVKGKNKVQTAELPIDPAEVQDHSSNAVFYNIVLDKALAEGQSTSIDVQFVLTHAMEPFPVEIRQSDVQLVLHHDSAYFLSPYLVKHQTSFFKLPSSRIESYTRVDPCRVLEKDKEIKYGPYENIAPFTSAPITIHFENNQPFAVVKVLEREIEISHWGNVYVTENYHLTHAGARLKGGFSRLDYQSKPSASGVSSFRHLFAKLPARAHSVYYRDEIGNISTSHLRSDLKRTEVMLEPRYPLFGGWQVTFTLGYGLPLRDFLFSAPDGRRYLNFSFGSPITGVVVDKLVVKVVLPEGSKDASVSIPFPVDLHHETKSSYLDTVGRTVVVLTKENVVPEHNVFFQVYYKFNPLAMLAEPLMLIFGFFCFFLASMAYLHFDFPISKSSGSYQARVQQEEVLDALQRLQKVMKRRLSEAEKLEVAMRDLARTGDVSACKASRKLADAALKDSSKEVKAIYESLQTSSRSTSILSKVDTLILKEKEKQDKLLQKLNLTVDLYEKKLPSKEIDARIAPHEQKYAVLKQEVADAVEALDD